MPPRKCLSLEDRVKAIRLLENGKSSRTVAEEMGVGRTQIQRLLKRKAEVLEDYESNANPMSKRARRVTGNEEINELCWKWFQDATGRRINVSGPLIQEKAKKFALDLGVSDFKGSNGWLESFLKRHNIVFKTMSGERGDVDSSVVTNWKEKLPSLCEGYKPDDIFNMDESGLFFRDTTKSTFFVKGDDCSGGKRSKDRITVALCASMTGEKVKPLVIGKSRNPRCFSKISADELPVTYRNNKKAWMTSGIFEDWLKSFDRQMRKEKRNVLLFVDNAPSHPTLQMNNVKLQFLPANTTSVCQPMDQGIIQAAKLKYRKRQLQYVISEMDKNVHMCGTELLKRITVLDAIFWINKAWEEVDSTTIQKCFLQSGFQFEREVDVEADDEPECPEDNNPLSVLKMARKLFDCEFKDLLAIDDNFKTCETEMRDWDRPVSELLDHEDDVEASSDTEDSDFVTGTTENVSLEDAYDCIRSKQEGNDQE